MRTAATVTFIVAAAALAPTDVEAYALEGASWPNGNITMQLALGQPSAPLSDGSVSWDDVAASALSLWNVVIQRSQFVAVKNSVAPQAAGNGYNNAFFGSTVYGQAFGNRVLALTLTRYSGTRFVEADTVFNTAIIWDSYRGALRYSTTDLRRVALHEFGHTLGLDHPDQANPPQNVAAIMNSLVSNIETLQADDIAGAEFLYGSNTAPASPGTLSNVTVAAGGTLTIALTNTTAAAQSYTWQFTRAGGSPQTLLDGDGNAWTTSTYTKAGADPSDAGTYSVAAIGTGGTSPYVSATVTVTSLTTANSRLVNLSARGVASTGDNTMIVGFVTSGSTAKSLLVRAVGPTLASQGVSSPLPDPQLTLHNSTGAAIATDDDWSTGATSAAAISAAAQHVGAFALPTGSKDAALLVTLPAGLYSATVGVNGSSGIALLEIYDNDASTTPATSQRLVNLSARDYVGTGDQVLIGGFVIGGTDPKRILLRAVGPGLSSQGVSGLNTDPYLALYQGQTKIATNDDWSRSIQSNLLPSVFTKVGAFQLQAGSPDSAILLTLPPGLYTAQVSGRNGETGVTLLEIYEVLP